MIKKVFILLTFWLITSCSGTKHLPEGEKLYVGTRSIKIDKVEYEDPWKISRSGSKKSLAYYNLWDLPNGSFGIPYFRGIPFRLIFYNWFYTEKEKGFSHWMMKNFGEPPVIISRINPELKANKVKNLYENWGHFGTEASYEVRYSKKKPKASVYYTFRIPKAYTFRNIQYLTDSLPESFIYDFRNYRKDAVLHPGQDFDLGNIRKEKSNIINHFHDAGYYYLRETNLNLLADTSVGDKQIDVRFGLDDDLPNNFFKKQLITSQTITIDSVLQKYSDEKFYHFPTGRFRKKLLDSLVLVKPGDQYSFTKVKTSIRNIAELGYFTNPLISFSVEANDSIKLNSRVSMQVADATTIGFNAKANYKNIGYIGPSVGLSFNQLNIFGGAENLNVDIDAYYDLPIGVFKERISPSSGISLNSTLSAPLAHSPFRFITQKHSLPKKFLSFRAELNDRKDYFNLTSWNAATGITWKSRPNLTHRFSIVDATYSNIKNPTVKFDSLTAENPSLEASLIDQFIIGTSYLLRYDNSSTENKFFGTFFEGKVESAGNLLSLISPENKQTGYKEFLSVQFSQLLQFSYDFRAYLRLGANNQLAFRHIGGIGSAYGNSDQMPYIKQYFIGGSTSLRPINARSVGPGRYLELNEGEVNQVGDMKLEWNLEYRIKLGPRLSTALFADAGNIWLLEPDPNRPDAAIRWNSIFKDSYLTAGIGLRLDVEVLIIRFDYGAVLYAPIFIDGEKWIWQNNLPLYGAVIGFGLPF